MRAVLAATILIGFVVANLNASRLDRFCSGKDVSLKTIDDLDGLVGEASSPAENSCSKRVLEALNEMNSIVGPEEACTMSKAKAIVSFVDEHLKKSAGVVPKSLTDFAIAYGVQTARACGLEIVASFSAEADAHLNRELGSDKYDQYEAFKRLIVERSPVGVLLPSDAKVADVILNVILMRLVLEDEANELALQIPATNWRPALVNVCANLLQPMYEPSLLPLAHLVQAGFIDGIKSSGAQDVDERVRFWSDAVLICEHLKTTETIVESDAGEQIEPADELLENSPTESREIDAIMQLVVDNPVTPYRSSKSTIGNVIVDDSMSSIVRAFHGNRNQFNQLQEKMLSSSVKSMKAILSTGDDSQAFRETLKVIKAKRGTDAERLLEVKTALDEFIANSRGEKSSITSSVACQRNRKSKSFLGKLDRACRMIWSPVNMLISASLFIIIGATSLISNAVLKFVHLKQRPQYSFTYILKQIFAPKKRPRPQKLSLNRMDTRRFEALRSSMTS